MFLATTALSDFWEKDQEILFLGSWCLRYDRRHEWKGLRGHVLPSPWDDRERFFEGCRQAGVYYERMLVRLCAYLNAVHGVAFGPRYWRIVIGPWLLRYVHASYDRFVCLREALDRYPGLHTVGMSSHRVPANFEEAVELIAGDPYNLQIYSQQLRSLGYHFPARPLEAWSKSRKKPARSMVGAAKRALRPMAQLAGKLQPSGYVALQGLRASDAWALALRTRFLAIPLVMEERDRGDCTAAVFDARRKGLAALPATDEFERVLVESLPGNVPVQYLEGFAESSARVLRQGAKPAAIVSAVWAFNDPFKFLAAETAERGGKLIAVQHGGGYGLLRSVPTELEEAQSADAYGVWGWADSGCSSCINLPHPRIATFLALQRRRTASQILYVATAHPRYLFRFESTPVSSQWEEYFDWQYRFFSAAPRGVCEKLVYRAYPQDYGQAAGERIADRFPGVRQENGVGFRKQLETTSIAVIDHPMTSFLETLTANVPTLLFWDASRWEVRPEAEPYCDGLRRAGILWDTPEGASANLEQVHSDPARWWNQPVVQQARERFIGRYALSSHRWREEWARVVEESVTLPGAETIAAP